MFEFFGKLITGGGSLQICILQIFCGFPTGLQKEGARRAPLLYLMPGARCHLFRDARIPDSRMISETSCSFR